MKLKFNFITTICCCLSLGMLCDGGKILFNIPLTTVSEQSLYTPLVNVLADQGHQVTVLVREGVSHYLNKNIKEIVSLNVSGYLDSFADPLANRKLGWKMMINFDYGYNTEGCRRVYENANFLKTFQKERYDLIITNMFFHGCLLGVLHKFQGGVPFIFAISHPPTGYTHALTGARMPTSFVPNPLFSLSDQMNFVDRFWNTVLDHYSTFYCQYFYMPAMNQISRHYLGEDVPNVVDIEKNFSLIFSNSHFTISSSRPLTPDLIEIGGLHCRPGKPLPQDLDNFLSESGDHGFIYFSMGTVLKSSHMDHHFKKMFLNIFAALEQRIVWKYEADDLVGHELNVSANVKIVKWLPQQDILAHPKCKIFITHAGMFSTLEATYHGVPMLGLPIFIDQDHNIHQAVQKGYALPLDILELTEQNLKKAIHDLLENESFSKKAKEASAIFQDQMESPMDRAVYWIEYVIRHKGADHLKSAARNLNFIQYHCLDVIFVLIVAIILVFTIFLKILFFIIRCILTRIIIIISKRKVLVNHDDIKSGKNSSKKKQQ